MIPFPEIIKNLQHFEKKNESRSSSDFKVIDCEKRAKFNA